MTERMMIASQLYEGRKFTRANFFSAFTTWRKRTTCGQMREIGRLSRNLIKLAMFSHWIRNRTQQSPCVRIPGLLKEISGWRLLKNFSGVHHDNVIGHPGDYAEIMGYQNYAGAGFRFQLLYQLKDLCLN